RAAAGARSRSPAGATARKAPWRPSAAAPRRASRSRRGRRQQRLQGGADAFGDRRAAAAVAVDEDVHEPAFGRRLVLAGAEQADAVAHAAVAKLLHAQAGGDAAGAGDHAREAAVRFGGEADRGAAVAVEPAFGDQVGVDHGVEVAVVLAVVDVAVDVVVLPAGGDGQEVAVVGARGQAC